MTTKYMVRNKIPRQPFHGLSRKLDGVVVAIHISNRIQNSMVQSGRRHGRDHRLMMVAVPIRVRKAISTSDGDVQMPRIFSTSFLLPCTYQCTNCDKIQHRPLAKDRIIGRPFGEVDVFTAVVVLKKSIIRWRYQISVRESIVTGNHEFLRLFRRWMNRFLPSRNENVCK